MLSSSFRLLGRRVAILWDNHVGFRIYGLARAKPTSVSEPDPEASVLSMSFWSTILWLGEKRWYLLRLRHISDIHKLGPQGPQEQAPDPESLHVRILDLKHGAQHLNLINLIGFRVSPNLRVLPNIYIGKPTNLRSDSAFRSCTEEIRRRAIRLLLVR